LRVRGLGVPYLNRAGRGDLIAEVRVVTPKRLSDEQRKIFMMLGHTFGSNPDGESKGFLDKLKQALGSE
jgi:molecular chaperone DnaJ